MLGSVSVSPAWSACPCVHPSQHARAPSFAQRSCPRASAFALCPGVVGREPPSAHVPRSCAHCTFSSLVGERPEARRLGCKEGETRVWLSGHCPTASHAVVPSELPQQQGRAPHQPSGCSYLRPPRCSPDPCPLPSPRRVPLGPRLTMPTVRASACCPWLWAASPCSPPTFSISVPSAESSFPA